MSRGGEWKAAVCDHRATENSALMERRYRTYLVTALRFKERMALNASAERPILAAKKSAWLKARQDLIDRDHDGQILSRPDLFDSLYRRFE